MWCTIWLFPTEAIPEMQPLPSSTFRTQKITDTRWLGNTGKGCPCHEVQRHGDALQVFEYHGTSQHRTLEDADQLGIQLGDDE